MSKKVQWEGQEYELTHYYIGTGKFSNHEEEIYSERGWIYLGEPMADGKILTLEEGCCYEFEVMEAGALVEITAEEYKRVDEDLEGELVYEIIDKYLSNIEEDE